MSSDKKSAPNLEPENQTEGGDENKAKPSPEISRRQFLIQVGAAGLTAAIGSNLVLPGELLAIPNSIPNSEGFLLVDLKKCQGCGTCMMACALAHLGIASYTLSRIQIQQDSFVNWPDDIFMATCRQCQDAPCVEVCPVRPLRANKPDPKHGNVRKIDPQLCIGCKLCLTRCPYTPSRIQWNRGIQRSQKCDLCADTPFFGERGGPGGSQACVKVCPVNAVAFTKIMPDQDTEESYFVNLRGPAWGKLGMTTK